jgi:biopolymer transport protein ExbB
MPHIFHVIIGGIRQLGSGGSLLIPLLFCSLFAHAIIMERFYNLRRRKLMPRRFIARIYRVLEKDNPEMALSLCEARPGPLTRILKVGIVNRHLTKDDLWVVLDVTARLETLHLQKYLRTLEFLGTVAVLIGLLGTVWGIYIVITAAWRTSSPDTGAIVAGGISLALHTTAAGLAVALPAMVGYSYFMAKASSIIDEMTRHSFSLVRFFTTGRSQLVEQEAEMSNGRGGAKPLPYITE